MNKKTPNHTVDPYEEEEEPITLVHYIPIRVKGRLARRLQPFVKWVGFLSTVLLGIAALEPGLFKIPLLAQGWVFIVFILWIFSFCVGMFNL